MKSEKENEKNNLEEMGVAIEVDSEVIQKVRSGEITHIVVEINEDNQNIFLENFDGNLVLVTEDGVEVLNRYPHELDVIA